MQPPSSYQPARFSGVGSAIAGAMTVFEKKPMVELMATDFLGMTGPRTTIELVERGPDMAIETFIREITSPLTNLFVPSALAALVVLTRDRWLSTLTPGLLQAGVPMRPWVSGQGLCAFSKLYNDALQSTRTIPEARQQFIEGVLKHLQATDAHFPNKVFPHIFEQTLGQEKSVALMAGKTALQKGQLSDIRALTNEFKASHSLLRGTFEVEAYIQNQLKTYKADFPEIKLTEKQEQKLVHSFRRQASKKVLMTEKDAIEHLTQLALKDGLSEKVHLLGSDGKPLLKNRKLSVTLKELKHFLEYYVDRANHGLPEALTVVHSPQAKQTVRETIQKTLFERRVGLVHRSVRATKWASVIAAAVAGCMGASYAFINNAISKRRHGGAVYFPGDGIQKVVRPQPMVASKINPFNQRQNAWPYAVQFGGENPLPTIGRLARFLDVDQLVNTTLNHAKLNYGIVILSRVPASISRSVKTGSWNEPREHITRDLPGWLSWFFVTPFAHRLLMHFAMPKDIRKHVLDHPQGLAKPASGFWEKTKWHLQTVLLGNLPSRQQLDDRRRQAVALLKANKDKLNITAEQLKQTETMFERIVRWRSYATFAGILMTSLVLGVGVMYLNIMLTRRKVAKLQRKTEVDQVPLSPYKLFRASHADKIQALYRRLAIPINTA